MGKFIQIHTLVNYSGVLLNRDENGAAKHIMHGGTDRTRVSSQCLKKHWRDALNSEDLVPDSVRSRLTFTNLVVPELNKEFRPEVVNAVVAEVASYVLTGKKKAAKKKSDGSEDETEGESGASTSQDQIVVLGPREIEFVTDCARRICAEIGNKKLTKSSLDSAFKLVFDDLKKVGNLEGHVGAVGLSAALFGRFITGNTFERVDAAVSVAHAMTVNAHDVEVDYLTAVDQLTTESGAALVSEADLTSGLFYTYVVIDENQLLHNLRGDADLAKRVVAALVKAIATTTPGAKKGSTAPFSYADAIFVEVGDLQPRTGAGAFMKPVYDNFVPTAVARLRKHLDSFGRVYGAVERKELVVAEEETGSLAELIEWALEKVGA